MRVIVDRIEEGIVIVEADDENTYKIPVALCPEAHEGDTIEIKVIGKQPAEEEPHAIFERLRKNSKRKKDTKKHTNRKTHPESNTPEKDTEKPD